MLDLGCLAYGCLLVIDLMVFVATLVWVFVAYCLFSGWVSLAFVVLDTCLVVVLVAVLRFGCWFIVGFCGCCDLVGVVGLIWVLCGLAMMLGVCFVVLIVVFGGCLFNSWLYDLMLGRVSRCYLVAYGVLVGWVVRCVLGMVLVCLVCRFALIVYILQVCGTIC